MKLEGVQKDDNKYFGIVFDKNILENINQQSYRWINLGRLKKILKHLLKQKQRQFTSTLPPYLIK